MKGGRQFISLPRSSAVIGYSAVWRTASFVETEIPRGTVRKSYCILPCRRAPSPPQSTHHLALRREPRRPGELLHPLGRRHKGRGTVPDIGVPLLGQPR